MPAPKRGELARVKSGAARAAGAPLSDDVANAIVEGRHRDPFAVLGIHKRGDGLVLRTFVPGAERVDAVNLAGKRIVRLARRHAAGLFEGAIARREPYRLRATRGADQWIVDDPYSHGPVLGPMDDWLMPETLLRRPPTASISSMKPMTPPLRRATLRSALK